MKAGVLTLELIRQIILGYITDLSEEQVNIYNQKFTIPDSEGLFATLHYNGGKVFANNSDFQLNTIYQETINLNVLEDLSINVMSENLEAMQMKELFVMALRSYFSEGLQEVNGFKILRIAPIQDISSVEGASRLFRYEIPFKVFAWYQNITPAEYFNAFKFQVIANGNPELETPIITQPLTQPIL